MKQLILVLLFVIILDNLSLAQCAERGHVGGVGTQTEMYCPPILEDSDSMSVMVYPSCNTFTYRCSRCGETVTEKEKEVRVIIWRKGEHDR